MKATNTWHTSYEGLVLRTEVQIEGERFTAQFVQRPFEFPGRDYPAQVIERDLRRQIMHRLEQRIFGDAL